MSNLDRVESVVKAVLYEGYMLYPYRPTSVKNRQRWTFGGVYPRDCHSADSSLSYFMQTECLVIGTPDTTLDVQVRFLHLICRQVGRLSESVSDIPDGEMPEVATVAALEVGDRLFHAWDEATERTIEIPKSNLGKVAREALCIPFTIEGDRMLEPLRGPDDLIHGVLIRTSETVKGKVRLSAVPVNEGAYRVTVGVENVTPVAAPHQLDQGGMQRRAFASTHTILTVADGAFVSLIDPPPELADAAEQCENRGTWPVLAGAEGAKDVMLSSPIILYDYPEVAPESPGDLFDATEIDEILTLRILTMTDDEKREMVAVDERARALLERTEALTADDMSRLHGTLRYPQLAQKTGGTQLSQPSSKGGAPLTQDKPELAFLHVAGTDLKVGDRVLLRPKRSADIMDIVLDNEIAVIEAIERDFEDNVHVAVVLENDPGREFGMDRMPGHRFFFSPEEIEPVAGGVR